MVLFFLKEAIRGKCQQVFGCLGQLAARFGVRTPVQHAMFGGYVSVLTGATEFVLSIIAGEDEDSSSLLGISIMAFAEIVGSLLVLWRWRHGLSTERGSPRQSEQLQEVYFAGAIAVMTASLGVMLLRTSIDDLLNPSPETSVAAGIFVSAFGASCSFLLWAYKAHYGRVLRSMVLLADAKCSLCVGLISLAVVAALVLEKLYWWADSATSICLSLYIIYEGVLSVWEARQQFVAHLDGEEGLRLVPLMHERLLVDKGEETALLEETM
ncbi:unnamed protein product [Scytosiphon promiscuus]